MGKFTDEIIIYINKDEESNNIVTLAESYMIAVYNFLSEYIDIDKLYNLIMYNFITLDFINQFISNISHKSDAKELLSIICEKLEIDINEIPNHVIKKIIRPIDIINEFLASNNELHSEEITMIGNIILDREKENLYNNDEMKKSSKKNIIENEVEKVITLSELHLRRIENFKKFVEANLSHFPTVKESLSKIGDVPLSQFIEFIDSIVLPKKSELEDLLIKLCEKLGIDIKDIPVDVINKIIKFLQYFCDFVEEAKKN